MCKIKIGNKILQLLVTILGYISTTPTYSHCQDLGAVVWWRPWRSWSLSERDTWATLVIVPVYNIIMLLFSSKHNWSLKMPLWYNIETIGTLQIDSTYQSLVVFVEHQVVCPLHSLHEGQICLELINKLIN